MDAHRNQYLPATVDVRAQGYRYSFQRQDFQYFVVIDFEATCDKGRTPYPQEIIEFPSVIVNSATGHLEASFQIYVRPTCNPLLSDFCKNLTGIQQIQVDRGVPLSQALLRHDKWLEERGVKNTNFVVVTWSNSDCEVMLESECSLKKIPKPPYFNRWIDLRVAFREVFGVEKCKLREAVEMAGLVWEGRAHCGLDDAKNTARLLSLLMLRGFKFFVTDSLHDHPMPRDPRAPVVKYRPLCYCGVRSFRQTTQKPGPMQGCDFFCCGKWSVTDCGLCDFFEWAI